MNKPSHITSFLLLLFLLSMATEQRLSAYVDPGSGAMFVQIILAGLIGILYRMRNVFTRLRRRKPGVEAVAGQVFTR